MALQRKIVLLSAREPIFVRIKMNMEANYFYAQLHDAVRTQIGARIFTVTVQDVTAGVVRRAYTSHPDDYPLSGTKPLQTDAWSKLVLERGEVFLANTTAEFAQYFPDYALINALGCHSAMNVPIIENSEVIGTINILDVQDHFTPEKVQWIKDFLNLHHDEIASAMRTV